jgi:putative peptidoglycan lipid II flippase
MAIAGFTIFAKLAGAAKTVFSARYFAPGADLDAWFLAFLIPSFLADVLSGALNPSLVPVLVEARNDSRGDSEAIYSAALYRGILLTGGIGIVLGVLALAIDPASIGIHLANPVLARNLLLIMAPMLPLSAVAGVWRSVLNAEMHFAAAALSPILSPLIIMIFLLFSGRWGVSVLAFGSTCGIVAELAALSLALRSARLPVFPKWVWRNAPFGRDAATGAGKEYAIIVASNLVMRGSILVDQAAAAMVGQGAISVFNFGTRLVVVLLAIGPASLSTAILPRFSAMAATRRWMKLRRSLVVSILASTVAMAVVVALLIGFSEPIVRLAFLRGAFTADDAHRVALVQSCSLIQAPFAIGLAILSRLLASMKANRVLLPLSLAGLALNIAFDYLLMTRYGVAGIALSAAFVQAFLLTAVGIVVFRRLAPNEIAA